VRQLEAVSNKVPRVMDFWFESVLEEYIVEFAIEAWCHIV